MAFGRTTRTLIAESHATGNILPAIWICKFNLEKQRLMVCRSVFHLIFD